MINLKLLPDLRCLDVIQLSSISSTFHGGFWSTASGSMGGTGVVPGIQEGRKTVRQLGS